MSHSQGNFSTFHLDSSGVRVHLLTVTMWYSIPFTLWTVGSRKLTSKRLEWWSYVSPSLSPCHMWYFHLDTFIILCLESQSRQYVLHWYPMWCPFCHVSFPLEEYYGKTIIVSRWILPVLLRQTCLKELFLVESAKLSKGIKVTSFRFQWCCVVMSDMGCHRIEFVVEFICGSLA